MLLGGPTRLSGSVVGAGRDHPKSLSIPGHRRPTKSNAEASFFASVTSAPFLSRRLTGLTGGSPLQPMTIRPKTSDHVLGHQCASSDRLACAIHPGSAGADVPTSNSSSSPCGSDPDLEDQVLEQSADFSANRLSLDVMKLSLNPICAKR
jgi:hypothetical protein